MERCVVRRTIKEAESGRIFGYEINIEEGSNESIDLITDFMMVNSNRFISDKMTIIPFESEELLRNTVHLFQAEKTIICLGKDVRVTVALKELVEELKREGYFFSTSVDSFGKEHVSLAFYIDYIGVDTSKEKDLQLIRDIHLLGKKCIAEGIESKELYRAAVDAGADFLEGGFIAKTLVKKVDKFKFLKGNFFQFMIEILNEEPRISVLEKIVKRDAGMTYALLRMANSCYFALRKRTESIQQSLVIIGLKKLKQWSYMMSLRQNIDDPASEELLKLSFTRAKFASELVHYMKGCSVTSGDAYMIGMFSTMEYMVDGNMEEILDGLPLNDDVKIGLIDKKDVPGDIYRLIISYERAYWKQSKQLAKDLGLPVYLLAQIYINCIESVNQIWGELMVEYKR
ncbi:c-di-GMP-related signal transduction protein [Aequitasia blattaphilus]|uniref:HDOD domain-containing protein n=1 Tax=Aequitasia blattaphilus TaxID=2949332 RepID=A0ABT1E9L5_9FIRM|nr:HDOD domain-containing protein [Aequitasia blattaphilus]MCP1102530.1 HDOD domain-containing protein [Aequitasia blattaphilus]MCR8615170.1 HDOD domain-containing protein [Aequitasia blattaphilus]